MLQEQYGLEELNSCVLFRYLKNLFVRNKSMTEPKLLKQRKSDSGVQHEMGTCWTGVQKNSIGALALNIMEELSDCSIN